MGEKGRRGERKREGQEWSGVGLSGADIQMVWVDEGRLEGEGEWERGEE